MVQSGIKDDDGKVQMGLIMGDFARALCYIGKVGQFGINKYVASGWIDVPDGIQRYTDAMFRHVMLETIEVKDHESGLPHAAHTAWCALARLDLMLREYEKRSVEAHGYLVPIEAKTVPQGGVDVPLDALATQDLISDRAVKQHEEPVRVQEQEHDLMEKREVTLTLGEFRTLEDMLYRWLTDLELDPSTNTADSPW